MTSRLPIRQPFDLASRASHDEDNELVWKTPNQHVRVLQWMDIGGDELLDAGRPPYILLMEQSRYPYAHMQERIPDENFLADYRRERDGEVDLEWLGILAAAGMTDNSSDLRECHYFYPQVFYGYWVPVDPGTLPDNGDERETDLVEYDPSTCPFSCPKPSMSPGSGRDSPWEWWESSTIGAAGRARRRQPNITSSTIPPGPTARGSGDPRLNTFSPPANGHITEDRDRE